MKRKRQSTGLIPWDLLIIDEFKEWISYSIVRNGKRKLSCIGQFKTKKELMGILETFVALNFKEIKDTDDKEETTKYLCIPLIDD